MMIPSYLVPLANHLWQSSVFAGAVGLISLGFRKNRASIRYWLWLTASVKFLIPFTLLMGIGSLVESPIAPTPMTFTIREIGQPFSLPIPAPLLEAVPETPSRIPAVLFGVWICGFSASAFCWLRAWMRMRRAVRGATRLEAGRCPGLCPIRVMGTPALVEPCVFGVLRPVLLLPDGIRDRLTPDQLETIVVHEMCHVRRADNLTAAIHMVTETLFWFYPPAYWIGKRMMDERESACDEEVLRIVARPEVYAQGILAVCRFALEPSPVWAAGVAGSDLTRRIEGIMGDRAARRLGWGRRVLLAAAAMAAVGGPFVAGALFVRSSRAQAQSVTAFGVVSIKPAAIGAVNSGFRRLRGSGELNATNVSLKTLVAFAYDIPGDRILQGPGWIDSDRYEVLGKPEPGGNAASDQSMNVLRLRTQMLLADRFKLTQHKETRQLPIFKLLVDKGGPKNLKAAKGGEPDLVSTGHHVSCTAASMEFFARVFLTGELHAPVLDQTGIKGNFQFSMDWAASDDVSGTERTGPSLFSALKEQLGLKLEATKGPVEVLVIDRAEKASEN